MKCSARLAFLASSFSFFETFLFVMGSNLEKEHFLFNKIAFFGNKEIGSTPLGFHRSYDFFMFLIRFSLFITYLKYTLVVQPYS